MNSLFQELNGGQNQSQQQQTQNNNFGILGQLYNFAQNFKGDPKQQVQDMLRSGQISQQDYNNAVNQANMLYNMIGGKR